MPHSNSAKKRLRQNLRRRTANKANISRMRTEVKKAQAAIEAGKLEEGKERLRTAYKVLDKAAKRNIIHANKAAREKSKIARKLSAAEKQ